jgi:hypothetical protein
MNILDRIAEHLRRCAGCGHRGQKRAGMVCMWCWERIPGLQRVRLAVDDSSRLARLTVLADQLENGVAPEHIVVPR